MSFFNWFKRTQSPTELMKKREDAEFIEQIRRMAVTVTDRGGMTNHGLSEYGANKLLEEGREPGPLEQRVLIADGTFISFKEWKVRNSK